jgi:predicted DNA-binding transcriptional regulator AlpA
VTTPAPTHPLAALGLAPGCLSLAEAAAYVRVSPRTFERQVKAGVAPQPVRWKSRRRVWSRTTLDAWLAGRQMASCDQHGDPIMRAIEHAKAKGRAT